MSQLSLSLMNHPMVLSTAEWLWGDRGGGDYHPTTHHDMITTMISPDICLAQVPFLTMACWQPLVVKLVGIVIIVVACFYLAPVMINIYQAKSSDGISRSAIYAETLVNLNSAVYGWLEQFPFTAYGESVAITIQGSIIVFMIWKYSSIHPNNSKDFNVNKSDDGGVSFTERVVVMTFAIVYTVVITTYLPHRWRYLLMTSTWPLLLYGYGLQIFETYHLKQTGAQSIVTISLNLIGGIIRILTTIQEVGMDMAVIAGYGLVAVASFIMLVQYFLYRHNNNINNKNGLSESKKKD